MNVRAQNWLSTVVVAAVPLCASPSLGQTPIAPAQTVTGSGKIEEVVVTAEKRSELAQDVPASISVFGSAALEQRGLANMESLQFETPNLQYGEFGSIQVASIRGVGTNVYGAGVQPGVALYIDGVYQARTMTGNLTQIDLDRVEVLRGPAGTVYGRNAIGGAINFITQQPTNELGGYMQAGLASYGEYRMQGVANIPLSNSVRTRLTLDYDNRQDGFIKNVVPGQSDLGTDREFSRRFQVAVDLTPNLSLNLTAYAVDAGGNDIYVEWYKTQPNFAPAQPIVPLSPRHTSANDPSDTHRHLKGLTGTLNWDMGWAALKSITAYYTVATHNLFDADGVNLSIAPERNSVDSKTFSQEFDLSGKRNGLDWVAGLYYLDDTLDYSSRFDAKVASGSIPAGVSLVTGQSPYDTKSYAAFIDGTYSLTDALRLIGGLRYSRDDLNVTQTNETLFGTLLLSKACFPPETFSKSYASFTPRGGLQYDIDANENVYFTVSRGFKAGGFNSGSCDNGYAPEHVTSYEVGFKSSLLSNSLILDAAAFYYDYTDLQLLQYAVQASTIVNAPKATIEGLEFQTTWVPDEHWQVDANFSVMDATYDDFHNLDQLNPSVGLQNLAGNALDRSPKLSGNIGVQYATSELDGIGRFTVRADAYATSRIYYREFQNALDSQTPYGLFNLSLIWNSPNKRFMARLYATNLTDTDYITSLGSTNSYDGRFVTWAPPRQIGVELREYF